MVEEGGGADERAYHVLRLFSISLFVRLFVCSFVCLFGCSFGWLFVCLFVCFARAYVREEKCCKFLQMKIFQVLFLVF